MQKKTLPRLILEACTAKGKVVLHSWWIELTGRRGWCVRGRGCPGRQGFGPKISNQIFNPTSLDVAVQSSRLHSKCRTLFILQNRSLFWSRSRGSNPEQHLGFSGVPGTQCCPPELNISRCTDFELGSFHVLNSEAGKFFLW